MNIFDHKTWSVKYDLTGNNCQVFSDCKNVNLSSAPKCCPSAPCNGISHLGKSRIACTTIVVFSPFFPSSDAPMGDLPEDFSNTMSAWSVISNLLLSEGSAWQHPDQCGDKKWNLLSCWGMSKQHQSSWKYAFQWALEQRQPVTTIIYFFSTRDSLANLDASSSGKKKLDDTSLYSRKVGRNLRKFKLSATQCCLWCDKATLSEPGFLSIYEFEFFDRNGIRIEWSVFSCKLLKIRIS